jgi:hypothetical protein
MTKAKGTIKHNDWDEKPYHEANGQKSTKATINCVFDGDLTATARTDFLMQYPTDKSAHYCGYLLVEGELAGKAGTFMIYELGTWENGVASSHWQILDGSGTGALKGISGQGSYAAEHDKTVHYEIDYQLS